MRISARGALAAAALAAVAAGASAQPTLAEFLAGVLANPGQLIYNLARQVAERQLYQPGSLSA